MKKIFIPILLLLLAFNISCEKENTDINGGNNNDSSQQDSTNNDTTPVVNDTKHLVVKLHNDDWSIYLWLFDETPIHKERFLWLTKKGYFDQQTFNRIVNNFVVQGGTDLDTVSNMDTVLEESSYEKVEGLVHQLGALGAARTGDDVNPERKDMGDQFYICEEISASDAARLDTGYVIFGQVISNLDVITDLGKTPVSFNGSTPVNDIYFDADTVSITESFMQDSLGFSMDSLMIR